MAVGVTLKALLMTSVVLLLGATTFLESLALVLVSATATGVFGLLIVLIQVRSERSLHKRMDTLEVKATDAATKAAVTAETTQTIAEGLAGITPQPGEGS